MLKQLTFSAFLAGALLTGTAAAQIKSVYTSVQTKACRTIESTAEEGGFYRGICPGVGGYKVELTEGDIRQTLNVITPAKKNFHLKFTEYYGSFSTVGQKLEWRVKGGVPIALIARYNVADPTGERSTDTSYLMVSKISKAMSCVVDIIQPGRSQNEAARRSADTALSLPCKPTQ
jgi:hypothetical protein